MGLDLGVLCGIKLEPLRNGHVNKEEYEQIFRALRDLEIYQKLGTAAEFDRLIQAEKERNEKI